MSALPDEFVSEVFELSDERFGRTARITATGELDIASAPRLREGVATACGEETEIVVVDLSGVSFIDSSGLHALIDISATCGDSLRIILSTQAARLVDLVGLRDGLPIVEG